jgi:hypothetical protein
MIQQFLVPFLKKALPADSTANDEVSCSFGRKASCSRFSDGCFDYSPQVCDHTPGPEKPLGGSTSGQKPAPDAPARLWTDPTSDLTASDMTVAQQLCSQRHCQQLGPLEASLCQCLAVAVDASVCASATKDAAHKAQEAKLLCSPVTASR